MCGTRLAGLHRLAERLRKSAAVAGAVLVQAGCWPRPASLPFSPTALAAIFAACERDVPPAPVAVTNEPTTLLPSRGEARQIELA
jgi:hypothetical protein